MSKRRKINFDIINKGRFEIIPPEKIEESRARIRTAMKDFLKKFKKNKWNR